VTFSSTQLRAIQGLVTARLTYDCGDSISRWQGLLRETEAQIAAVAPRELVFRLELPIEPVDLGKPGKPCLVKLASTLNEYAGMKGWARAKARTAVDKRIVVARASWPRWHCGVQMRAKVVGGEVVKVPVAGTGRRRLVRVVRRSSRRIDEVSLDVVGGKLPVDRLKIAEIITGDSARWLEREAAWEPCDPGDGRVIVEVYDLPASLAAPRASSGTRKAKR
jgi:hypothetical protein